jgi:hypothetical protein
MASTSRPTISTHHHEHDIEDIDRQVTQQHDVHLETPIFSNSMPKDDLHLRTTN